MIIGYYNVEDGEGQEWKDPWVMDVEPQKVLDRCQACARLSNIFLS